RLAGKTQSRGQRCWFPDPGAAQPSRAFQEARAADRTHDGRRTRTARAARRVPNGSWAHGAKNQMRATNADNRRPGFEADRVGSQRLDPARYERGNAAQQLQDETELSLRGCELEL